MLDRVRATEGQILRPVQAYLNRTSQFWSRIRRFDKLERLQRFREPGYPSWDAFAAGRWEESLRLLREDPDAVQEFAQDARNGLVSYRVRVVEFPLDPYLHWELYSLKRRVELGEHIRVVGPDAVARFETDEVVPELIFMENQTMYEVLYDEAGVLAGGREITDPELIKGCLAEVHALYDQGEDLLPFFEREVAPLPPPTHSGK